MIFVTTIDINPTEVPHMVVTLTRLLAKFRRRTTRRL